jgi:ribosome-binding factor A
MRRDFSRTDRVSQQIQKEVAQIIQRDIKDPRVGMATVSSVEVSRDLSHAKVFVTLFNVGQDDEANAKAQAAVAVLNEAGGFIRSLLGKRIRARIMPQLRFVLDNTLMDGMRISNFVDQVIATDKKKQAEVDGEDEATVDVDAVVEDAPNTDEQKD